MTDFEFIKSISNVPKKPFDSVVKNDGFGHAAFKEGSGAPRSAFSTRPSPPWVQEPDTPRNSIGWKLGSGAEYRHHFKSWFSQLDVEARDAFTAEHPEPEGWRGFYGSLIEDAD